MSLGYEIPTDAPNYGIEKHGIAIKNSMPASRMDIESQTDYFIALHGTSRDNKLWPVENWVALQNLNMVLPWASDAEHARATIISQQVPNSIVLPKFSISELAGVIANAKAAVGVDTGLSHLAAALNIPTIAIYTDTNPELTGVMASAQARAVNLGNIAQNPSVNDVMDTLKKIL